MYKYTSAHEFSEKSEEKKSQENAYRGFREKKIEGGGLLIGKLRWQGI
jgi:hypothetical protein